MSFLQFGGKKGELDVLTVDVVDVVNSHLLVINFLPPERQLISNTVGKRQRFGDPERNVKSIQSQLK